ncbi:nicotinate phosphoribosyltransferase [Reichenbachiella sp. MALMAid0571]|uniref:nicotinate phosphoribosyltransferase n=1 Tax=Reichenbachiella sp. MALMAid0571 TaxID=3143939 RepID=UPI0032DF2714
MKLLSDLYSGSLTLLTDLYQLTMSYGYWKSGKANQEAVFNLFFRENPFKGGYTVACGLEYVIDYIDNFEFTEKDLEYLLEMKGNDGRQLFEPDFISFLRNMEFECDIDAVPEGTVVFPHEPMIRIRGPVYQCQLLETPLLNMLNFQTLIATKASRIKASAKNNSVLEFGLRRAQGIDGALAASRAAYIGGCDSTSNVLAGKLFDIPVSGTHAHSWVMSFEEEKEAFATYAKVMPNNVVLLVDTYDTIEGIKTAIEVGKEIKQRGEVFYGIRLDSGDLAYFSKVARQMLDEAGFSETKIVASNDLDEHLIASLKNQEAKIDIWGVGTKLVTAFDQPALGAVYKLSAIKNKVNEWDYKIKLSEQTLKINNPGIQQVKRFSKNGKFIGDMIYDESLPDKRAFKMIDPSDATKRKSFSLEEEQVLNLLIPIFRKGAKVYNPPKIREIKKHVFKQMESMDGSVKRFEFPHKYPVGLEESLFALKNELILKLRNH